MLLKEFYVNVISSETVCVKFLQDNLLLGDVDAQDPCSKCGSEMAEKRRKSRSGEWIPIFRCTKTGCQTSRTVRTGNKFFFYTDLNGRMNAKLTLCAQMELMFLFIIDIPLTTASQLTGRSTSTVTDWYNMCREVCTSIISGRPKMKGTSANPIQIDEARFAGRRKYNRGRLLAGDAPPQSEDEEADISNSRNHGARIDGPWVFGLRQGDDCRYFYVQRRDKATLLPIIKRECRSGSEIHSDEWSAYRCLTNEGFVHLKVNHQENYVDPTTGAHTQAIERSWLDAKVKLLKKMRGVPMTTFQSHLDDYCWRMHRRNVPDLFLAFLEDVRRTYA